MHTDKKNKRGNLLLLLAGLLSIAILMAIDWHWYKNVLVYWKEFRSQVSQQDPEVRKAARYGSAYVISKAIAEILQKSGQKEHALVLVPPTSYFKAKGLNYRVPEPAVFYYFTSLKTVRPDTKDTARINYAVGVLNGSIGVKKIRDQRELSVLLAEYRKYKITL